MHSFMVKMFILFKNNKLKNVKLLTETLFLFNKFPENKEYFNMYFFNIDILAKISSSFNLFKDRQELDLHFYNVQLLNFIGIYVMNTLKLKAVNVKEARFWNSTFAHIPVGGFEVSRAKLLNIKV